MFRWLNLLLLLLFCFVYHSGTDPKSVSGKKGGNVTLTCEFEDKNILQIDLRSETETIDVCQTEECSSQIFKEGSCDIIIKNLNFSDAGTYFLHVFYDNDQRELKRQIRTYQLHIHDEISVKTGEELKLNVLLANADKVEKNSSGEWTEVWRSSHGVRSDRLNDSDGNLIINEFTVTDAGTYRVLDSEGEIWITVTVTESSTGSKGKLDNINDHKTDNTQQKNLYIHLALVVSLGVVVMMVMVLALIVSVWKWRNMKHNSYQQTSVQETLLYKSKNGHL